MKREIINRVKKKISEESPFFWNSSSDDIKKQIVETFYRIVLDEIDINKSVGDFDKNKWDIHFKNFIPVDISIDSDRVYSKVPDLTDDFIKQIINERVEAGFLPGKTLL